MIKQTALYHIHKSLGAKMIPFAGFDMPVEYTGITHEHINVRENVGMFDISHMGDFWVKGNEALQLLQKVTTNDVSKLTPGMAQYTCLPNGKGGIVDDLIVYKYSENKYFLVVNASNIEKDWNWLNEHNSKGAILENASGGISQLAVQGPRALDTIRELCPADLAGMKYYTFMVDSFAGVEEVIISNTGYTGAGGFELYFNNRDAVQIWDAVMEAGKEYGIKPVGLAARDTLRLEMGFCLYGNDIDDGTSPIEAGLGWITKFTENNQFIDRELLEMQKKEGVSRMLVGFTMMERGIPRQHYEILDPGGSVIGEVTSGSQSPVMNLGIGLGYVKSGFTAPGTELLIQVRKKQLKAMVVKLPIYKKERDG